MKNWIFTRCFILLLVSQTYASSDLAYSVGAGFRRTTWKFIESADNTNTNYNIEKANYTIFEGDIYIPKLKGLKLGVNIHQDSGDLSKIRRFAGYLGLKNISIKSERGKFSGTATFSGSITAEQSANVSFDQIYQFTEISYAKTIAKVPAFFGLRYTKWKLPTEIALLDSGQASGPTVFDVDFETSFYSLIFGMDYFKWQPTYSTIKNRFQPGWGLMFNFLSGFGIGSSSIGDKAARASQTIYGKKMTETSPSIMAFHIEGQLGPKYSFKFLGAEAALGVGYDINLLMLINLAKAAESSTEVKPVAYPNFINHGPIIRFHSYF